MFMKSIRDVAGGELAWVQPTRTKQAFELRSGDEVVGTLVWARMSLAGRYGRGDGRRDDLALLSPPEPGEHVGKGARRGG